MIRLAASASSRRCAERSYLPSAWTLTATEISRSLPLEPGRASLSKASVSEAAPAAARVASLPTVRTRNGPMS